MHISKGIKALQLESVTLPDDISRHLSILAVKSNPSYINFGFRGDSFSYDLDNEPGSVSLFKLPFVVEWRLRKVEGKELIFDPYLTASDIATDGYNNPTADAWLQHLTDQLGNIGIGVKHIYQQIVVMPQVPWVDDHEPFYCLQTEAKKFAKQYINTLTGFLSK